MADPTPLLGLDRDDFRAFANRLDVMGGLIATFAPDSETTDAATLTFGYRGGRFIDDAGAPGFEPDGTIAIPNNVTRYVHFDPVNGVTIAAALDRTKFVIAQVRTGSASPSTKPMHIEDLRDINLVTPERTRWRGDWAAGTYFRNDMVLEGGALYIANTTTTAQPPDTDWDLLVSGAAGLDVQDEGVSVVAGATAIDFVGAGVEVTDVGGVPTVEVLAAPGPGGGILDFPDSIPTSPSQYDEEGDQGSLDADWTETSTPHTSYVRETNRDGTFIGMSGPGNATHTWTLRKPIDNAHGDYPTAFTLTAKVAVSGGSTGPAILIGVGNNATFLTNTYIIFGLLAGTTLTSQFYYDFNGATTTISLSEGLREIYVHLQRNTAATNNISLWISISGRAWVRLATLTSTDNFDYLWLYYQGGGASIPVALWTNYVRVNDARFLQPE